MHNNLCNDSAAADGLYFSMFNNACQVVLHTVPRLSVPPLPSLRLLPMSLSLPLSLFLKCVCLHNFQLVCWLHFGCWSTVCPCLRRRHHLTPTVRHMYSLLVVSQQGVGAWCWALRAKRQCRGNKEQSSNTPAKAANPSHAVGFRSDPDLYLRNHAGLWSCATG